MASIRRNDFRRTQLGHIVSATATWTRSIMDFRDQVILITGGEKAGRDIAERMLSGGARTVMLVGEAPVGAAGRAGLVWLSEDTLETPGHNATARVPVDYLDVVINLIDLSKDRVRADDKAVPGEDWILSACQDVVARTNRVVDATRVLLDRAPSRAAIVNLCCVTRTEATAGSAAATAGTLKTLTEALARQLAPHIRVNGVLWEAGAGGAAEDGFGPALFLASSAARHVTGTVLTADEGRRLGFAALAKADAPVGSTPNG
jgi:hypothetical protein